jgi:hypothetical protein
VETEQEQKQPPEVDLAKFLEDAIDSLLIKVNTSYGKKNQVPEDVESITKLIIATTNALEAVRLSRKAEGFIKIKHESLEEDLKRDLENLNRMNKYDKCTPQ